MLINKTKELAKNVISTADISITACYQTNGIIWNEVEMCEIWQKITEFSRYACI